LSTFPDRFPAPAINDTAQRLEPIAAELGIKLAPPENAHRPRPTHSAAAELDELDDVLVASDTLHGWQFDPRYKEWRPRHLTRFAEVVSVALDGEPPIWGNDPTRHSEGPATNLAGQIQLQRVLATEAWIAAATSDTAAAERILDAMWQLGRFLHAGPQPEAYRAAQVILDLQLVVLRHISVAPEKWRHRLTALDPMKTTLDGFMCEAWQVRRRSETLFDNRQPILGFIAQPFARALTIPYHEAMVYAVAELPRRDVMTLDPDDFGAEMHARLPRWNTIARAALPEHWGAWPRGVRAALQTELTSRVLELREHRLAEGKSAIQRLEPRQQARVKGLSWLYEIQDQTVTILVDPEPFADDRTPSLRDTVDLGSTTTPAG